MVKLILAILGIILFPILMLFAYVGMVFKSREFMNAYSWINGRMD